MKRLLCLAILATLTPLALSANASAGQCEVVQVPHIVNGLVEYLEVRICNQPAADSSTASPTSTAPQIPTLGGIACVAAAVAASGQAVDVCQADQQPQVVTTAMVSSALRRMPLPPLALVVEPPNGRTMVNFETNFLTEPQPLERTIQLLGQPVHFRIMPASFTWRFGDGEVLTTTTPGARYPDLQVTHDYRSKGDYRPRVDTTYIADWRVADGPWQRVPGTSTIAGQPVALQAVEVRPTLVASDGSGSDDLSPDAYQGR